MQWTLEYINLFKLVFLFSLNKCPRMELLDHMIAQCLIFWRSSVLFFIVAELIYIPKAMYEGSLFSISLPTCVISGLFDNSHSDKYKLVSYCGFHLYFPGNYWYWASFHVPVGHRYIFFGKISIQILCPFLKMGCLFMLSYIRFLHILDINPLSDHLQIDYLI